MALLAAQVLVVVAALVVLRPFLVPMAWAGILALATGPLFRLFHRWLGGRPSLVAVTTTAAVLAVIIVPTALVSFAVAVELQRVLRDAGDLLPRLFQSLLEASPRVPIVGPRLAEWLARMQESPTELQAWVGARLVTWGRALAGAAGDIGQHLVTAGVTVLTLFFLYRDGEALTGQAALVVRRYSGERLWNLVLLLAGTIRAVLYGTLFTAVAQALLAMPGYWLAEFGNPALLAVLTGLLALTPGGAALVWLPASVWLAFDGRFRAALLLAVWGALVVSSADNVIRSWFLSGVGRMPFLLSLLGILGGVAAFGAIGLFVGPATLAVLLALWREWSQPG